MFYKKNIIKTLLILIFILCANYNNLHALEITISREEGHFTETIAVEQINDKVYVILDDMVRIFKMVKLWHANNQQVFIDYDKNRIEMFIDNSKITINKKIVDILDPPRILKGNIMLPLSFVYNNLPEIANLKITWDESSKTLKINKLDYSIVGVRSQVYPNFTRVAVDLTKELDFHIDKQTSTRFTVTIKKGMVDTDKCKIEKGEGLIKEISSVQLKENATIYIDLNEKNCDQKSFLLTNPFRLVIDIKSTKTAEIKTAKDIKTTKIEEKKEQSDKNIKADTSSIEKKEIIEAPITKEPEVIKKNEETNEADAFEEKIEKRKISEISVVVIDPGHGGKDPGAMGPTGLKEKDVVLKIGKQLKNILVKKLGIRVILTREGDYFVSLEERTRTANFNHADLFISIHTNASFRSRSDGFEVFYFASGMNIDPYALAVVKKENSVMRLENKNTKMSDVDIIVYDVLQMEYMKESKEFAYLTQKIFDKSLNIRNRGVKRGPFFVIRNARMPSILVEAGFITNRKDEDNLNNDEFLNKVAKSLYDSIVKYKRKVEKNK